MESVKVTFYYSFKIPLDSNFDFAKQTLEGDVSFVYTTYRVFNFDKFHNDILRVIIERYKNLFLLTSYFDNTAKEFDGEIARAIFVESLNHGFIDELDGYTRDKVFRVRVVAI